MSKEDLVAALVENQNPPIEGCLGLVSMRGDAFYDASSRGR